MIDRPFHPPADYYCESLAPVDEQICALLAKRKGISKNKPGFPHPGLISGWCEQYGLNEGVLSRMFGILFNEHQFTTNTEPAGFLKFVSILKSVETNGVLHTVTYMKQYSNASVVYVETEVNDPKLNLGPVNNHFELFISHEYQCRPNGGYGHGKGMQHSFVVTPPLPDDVTGLEFSLTIKPNRELAETPAVDLTGLSVTIK